MTAFSRLQLAAALLEYDNDPDSPEQHRSAHDSAIFAHLRKTHGLRPKSTKTDYMRVPLPSETGSMSGRVSAVGSRKSRASINALQSMFGTEAEYEFDEEDEEDEEKEVEVDLTSWGLDAFMPKDKGSKHGRKKSKQPKVFPNPHPDEDVHTGNVDAIRRRPTNSHRTRSLGNIDDMALRNAFVSPPPLEKVRRASFGSPLDLAGMDVPERPFSLRRASDHPVIDSLPQAPPLHSIPFPTGSPRSQSPYLDDIAPSHARRPSAASLNSRYMLQTADQDLDRQRAHSVATTFQLNDNLFALEPPTNASRFDPKAAAHARTMSNVSMGSRFFNDAASAHTASHLGRERKISAMDLLRPKVLVMPSPLQGAPPEPSPGEIARDGFLSTSESGPPLPPGARSTRRSSTNLANLEQDVPVPSNSFIPNPRMHMTLSQMTFSNTLKVGGQQDASYTDVPSQWPRATEDGEQVNLEPEEEDEEPAQPADALMPPPLPLGRPAGKLFGKSLIDDLESRKAQMRSKQRVFTGDQRPSMMARGSTHSSTLIDPATLQTGPAMQRTSSYNNAPNLERRQSTLKPLLNFEDDKQLSPQVQPMNTRSVFGVDTLWEREMVKLREIEAAEKLEAERQAEIEAKLQTGKKGKHKGREVQPELSPALAPSPSTPLSQAEVAANERVSDPPVLPTIPTVIRGPPPKVDEDEDEESDSENSVEGSRAPLATVPADKWHDDSDEEKPQPVRTTGVGARYQRGGEDSDEDVPLSVSVARVLQKTSLHPRATDDSDEEKPLSMLMGKTRNPGNDDDDDAPLGLRASVAFNPHQMIDDDQPLALHPEQQRRTQYQMLAQQQFHQQQQMQQQQMMMQAQFQNSMFFNPAATMSGFFPGPVTPMGPPMGPAMMPPMIPIPVPSPPPAHDPANFARVDHWRRDVAIEGTETGSS